MSEKENELSIQSEKHMDESALFRYVSSIIENRNIVPKRMQIKKAF